MTLAQTSIVQGIADYLKRRALAFFGNYTEEALIDYVLFHVAQGTLSFTVRGREITGVMAGWAQDEPEPVRFQFQPHKPDGQFWYWHIFAADTPRDAIALARWFVVVHPEALARECLLTRHGKLRRLPPGSVFTIYRKAQRYGN